MSPSAFELETAVAPVDGVPGRYRAELSDRWCAPMVPQGGVATALAIRAMAAEIGATGQPLRSITNVFAGAVRAGPVEVDVTIVRRGRSMTHALAQVRNEGQDSGHVAVAVFGASREGFDFTDIAMPQVPPPLECPSFRDPLPEDAEMRVEPFTFWENLEGRPAIGTPPWDHTTPRTSSEVAYWYRYDDPPRLDDGTLDPVAVIAMCDTMPGSVGQRVGPTDRVWLPPSADLTVHLLGPARSDWLLSHQHARHAGDGYASIEMSLWNDDATLVAYATQIMFFVFPD